MAKGKKRTTRNVAIRAVSVIFLLSASLYLVSRSDTLSNQEVINKLSQLTSIPNNETPTIATIEDPEGLSHKDGFYSTSQKGDKIVVYPLSKRAFIYRPSTNIIVKDGVISE